MKQSIALLCFAAAIAGFFGIAVRGDIHDDDLSKAGIEPTAEGIRAYLRQLLPSPQQTAKIETLIKQLGDESFERREQASADLKKLSPAPRGSLEKALKNDDAEVRWRAEQLLKSGDDATQARLYSAFKSIARQQHLGLAKELIAVMPLIESEETRAAARKALAATVTKDDAPALRVMLKSADARERAGTTAALAAAIGRDAIVELRPMLADPASPVVFAAAKALADLGDRECLAAFVRLLESSDRSVADSAHAALRWLTGKSFAAEADGDDEKTRGATIAKWKAWLAAEGETAKLRTPIQLAEMVELFNGRDFAGWQAVLDGQLAGTKDVWEAKDGVIACTGKGRGYLRTKRSFTNYDLSLEWRWPGNQGGDSGVWLMMSGADSAQPRGLEIQLLDGKAGDFWLLGDLQCKADGNPVAGRYAPRKKPANEKKQGEWNRLDVRVRRGAVTVKINGEEQNAVTDCPKDPGCIALQVEGAAIEFRRLLVQPLED